MTIVLETQPVQKKWVEYVDHNKGPWFCSKRLKLNSLPSNATSSLVFLVF